MIDFPKNPQENEPTNEPESGRPFGSFPPRPHGPQRLGPRPMTPQQFPAQQPPSSSGLKPFPPPPRTVAMPRPQQFPQQPPGVRHQPIVPQFSVSLPSKINWILPWLSWTNLCGVLVACYILHGISEQWWVGTILTYFPRIPFLAPAVVLLAWSAFANRRYLWMNGVSALIVLGPLMCPTINWPNALGHSADTPDRVRVLSCNVQGFRPRFGQVLQEISQFNPDVVAFQEAYDSHPMLNLYFRDWHVIAVDSFFVASRHPVRLVDSCYSHAFNRVTALNVEVETPGGKIQLFNIHQTSQREGLVELRPWSMLTGDGVDRVERETVLRTDEAMTTRIFVDERDRRIPTVLLGDFNMPRESSLFQSCWSDFSDAFLDAGWGYGYTSLCHTRTFWPTGCPWVKVDHILFDDGLRAQYCGIGTSNGSDHRLICAELRLQGVVLETAETPAE